MRRNRILLIASVVAACTGVCSLLQPYVEPTNLAMVFLLGVTLVASRCGYVEALLASLFSIAIFDVAFVPPRWTLAVSDVQYLITFGAMLAVALLVVRLTSRLREQAQVADERVRQTTMLYELTRELSRGRSKAELAHAAAKFVASAFDGEVAVMSIRNGTPEAIISSPSGFELKGDETSECLARGELIVASDRNVFVPVQGAQGLLGVLAVASRRELASSDRVLLEASASTLASALERAQLSQEMQETRVAAESERMRNALLSSISHDLRTPLTAISGAASALVRQGAGELARTIYQESLRLNHQIQELLDMTRLRTEGIELALEWHSLEEVVGSAISRTREMLGNRHVAVNSPADVPLMRLDGALVEKLFVNLLENIAVHTPDKTRIEIGIVAQSEVVRVIVSDSGPGITPGQEEAIFERFSRAGKERQSLGLGLAICRAIMKLHGGRIWAQNRQSGGAEFHLEFPRPETQPEAPVE